MENACKKENYFPVVEKVYNGYFYLQKMRKNLLGHFYDNINNK